MRHVPSIAPAYDPTRCRVVSLSGVEGTSGEKALFRNTHRAGSSCLHFGDQREERIAPSLVLVQHVFFCSALFYTQPYAQPDRSVSRDLPTLWTQAWQPSSILGRGIDVTASSVLLPMRRARRSGRGLPSDDVRVRPAHVAQVPRLMQTRVAIASMSTAVVERDEWGQDVKTTTQRHDERHVLLGDHRRERLRTAHRIEINCGSLRYSVRCLYLQGKLLEHVTSSVEEHKQHASRMCNSLCGGFVAKVGRAQLCSRSLCRSVDTRQTWRLRRRCLRKRRFSGRGRPACGCVFTLALCAG